MTGDQLIMPTEKKSLAMTVQDAWGPGKSLSSARPIAYWIFTFLVAYEMVAGGIWDLLRIEYVRVILEHLGYPMYLLSIIGVWKIPCAVVLFLPGFLRLKEWAYAGAFFNYSGAAASHLFVGDGPGKWAVPLVLAGLTLASWALRPVERRLAGPDCSTAVDPSTDRSVFAWLVPVLVLLVMLALSFLFLPKGPPPA
jgi:hypothetical protein